MPSRSQSHQEISPTIYVLIRTCQRTSRRKLLISGSDRLRFNTLQGRWIVLADKLAGTPGPIPCRKQPIYKEYGSPSSPSARCALYGQSSAWSPGCLAASPSPVVPGQEGGELNSHDPTTPLHVPRDDHQPGTGTTRVQPPQPPTAKRHRQLSRRREFSQHQTPRHFEQWCLLAIYYNGHWPTAASAHGSRRPMTRHSRIPYIV